ncbi:dihydrolipoamide acetyltransferase family protein [Cellulosimicrobium marinum]|uniref:dihydrolipoamide acetyltransferase family protein n=1 Tax=Cellulosimicrobium marinum TaxID=1638992 RepID=UPI001E64B9EF|nr:dihydrolipoamide acetyltransferase family protein [Cellulosimicrobium marinum]MCB7135633.1 2-oxo acid dehydrogenase subunit E2 [Cellulosimicrobium marinum]
MATREFRLPDLGEGLTESDIVVWHVAAGDRVELNQVIAEVETAKALVDLPSPYAGVVATLHAVEGQTVSVGDPIVTFEVDDPAAAGAEPPPAEPGVARQDPSSVPGNPGFGDVVETDVRDVVEPNLVGYGAQPDSTGRPARRRRAPAPVRAEPSRGDTPGAEPRVERHAGSVLPNNPGFGGEGAPPVPDAARERPRSTPPVRALAKKLGVHVERVEGTGPDGLITRADVLAAVSCHRDVGPTRPSAPPAARPDRPVPVDERRPDGVERVPVRGVRKHTAAAMVSSASTAPHATVFLTADVTRSVELLDRLRTHRLARGTRVTVLALVARALCVTLPRHPDLNAAWHDLPDGSAEIWRHERVDLGIAVASERGLVVPHVPDASSLDLVALADALADLTATARDGRTALERLSGGTITITNVGVFGVDSGTPILVPGEAAILGLGAVRRRPWELDGEVALRDVVTLSLSFDHRVVDGEQAARFLADLGALLEDPALALLAQPARRAPGSSADGPDPAERPGVRQDGVTA